jgi:hypothetical protein
MLGALDADWMIEIELQSIRRVYCERIDWCIVRCMQQPGESCTSDRERGREVYAATVAHTPLAHPTESEKCMQPPKGSAHASQFLDSAFQT